MIEIYSTSPDEIWVFNQTFDELMGEIKSRINNVRKNLQKLYWKYIDCISLSYSSQSEKNLP